MKFLSSTGSPLMNAIFGIEKLGCSDALTGRVASYHFTQGQSTWAILLDRFAVEECSNSSASEETRSRQIRGLKGELERNDLKGLERNRNSALFFDNQFAALFLQNIDHCGSL